MVADRHSGTCCTEHTSCKSLLLSLLGRFASFFCCSSSELEKKGVAKSRTVTKEGKFSFMLIGHCRLLLLFAVVFDEESPAVAKGVDWFFFFFPFSYLRERWFVAVAVVGRDHLHSLQEIHFARDRKEGFSLLLFYRSCSDQSQISLFAILEKIEESDSLPPFMSLLAFSTLLSPSLSSSRHFRMYESFWISKVTEKGKKTKKKT